MAIFLIEGCNNVGKTTLATRLSHDMEIPCIHFAVPPENVYEHFVTRLWETMSSSQHLVVDRLHLSNFAYDGIHGGGVLSPTEWFEVDRLVADSGGWLLMLVDNPYSIVQRMRQEGDFSLTPYQIGDIQNRFSRAFERSQIEPKGMFELPLLLNEHGDKTNMYAELVNKMLDSTRLYKKHY
jgi:thymidylate kinase